MNPAALKIDKKRMGFKEKFANPEYIMEQMSEYMGKFHFQLKVGESAG